MSELSTTARGTSVLSRAAFSRSLGWAVGIVVWCAVAGYVAGRIWMTRWHAPTGQVVSHVWYPSPWDEGNRAAFKATGWFVLIALPLGLFTGIVAGIAGRGREITTMVAVLIGTCVFSAVMLAYGVHAAPADPTAAAKKAADGTVLLGTLAHPGIAALAVAPAAALGCLGFIYLLFTRPNT
jgi:hypothetical protein